VYQGCDRYSPDWTPKKLSTHGSESQRKELEEIVKGGKNRSLVFRALIILKCSEGMSNAAAAAVTITTPFTRGILANSFHSW
jgi:hypothetical protein